MIDAGGALWATITVVFVIALGAALAYGAWTWRHAPRDPETMARKDAATRRNYSEDAVEEVPLMSSESEKKKQQRRA